MTDANPFDPDPADEYLFAPLARHLMNGVDVGFGYCRLVKNNDKVTADDRLHYETDFRLELDGEMVGYLDIEKKPQWQAGQWPYTKINIARMPYAQWRDNRFDGRPTNKLLSFEKHPDTSFWVAVRADYAACLVVTAADIFNKGVKAMQPTRYERGPLPVYELTNDLGTFIDHPALFATHIAGKVPF